MARKYIADDHKTGGLAVMISRLHIRISPSPRVLCQLSENPRHTALWVANTPNFVSPKWLRCTLGSTRYCIKFSQVYNSCVASQKVYIIHTWILSLLKLTTETILNHNFLHLRKKCNSQTLMEFYEDIEFRIVILPILHSAVTKICRYTSEI